MAINSVKSIDDRANRAFSKVKGDVSKLSLEVDALKKNFRESSSVSLDVKEINKTKVMSKLEQLAIFIKKLDNKVSSFDTKIIEIRASERKNSGEVQQLANDVNLIRKEFIEIREEYNKEILVIQEINSLMDQKSKFLEEKVELMIKKMKEEIRENYVRKSDYEKLKEKLSNETVKTSVVNKKEKVTKKDNSVESKILSFDDEEKKKKGFLGWFVGYDDELDEIEEVTFRK